MSKRSGIMLASPMDENKLAKWPRPFIVQPKLDGIRCRAVFNDEGVNLISSQGRVLNEMLPHLAEILNAMPNLAALGELDGELYCHGLDFQSIQSMVGRKKNVHPQMHKINFSIFDIVSNAPQKERLELLDHVAKHLPQGLELVPWIQARDLAEVSRLSGDYLADGYEGVILRHIHSSYERKRVNTLMKFKPGREDDYLVTGAVEEIDINGLPKGRLGAILAKSDDGNVFSVGTGFTSLQREEMWDRRNSLPGHMIKVRYQELTSGRGVPRFPVFAGIY